MKRLLLLFGICLLLVSFAPKKDFTWMAIGDSITYLDANPGMSKNRVTKGYMQRVMEKLPYIHYKNIGKSGWSAASIADNVNKLGIEKADFYSVFLGTNDWWYGLPIGTFSDYQNNTGNKTVYGSYRTIINKIRELNPEATIILMTPMQRSDYADVNGTTTIHGSYKDNKGHFLSEYADAIKFIAKTEKLDLVDLYYKSGITPKTAMYYKRMKDPKTGEYRKYKYPEYTKIQYNSKVDDYPYPVEAMNMTYDGLHPSDKGLAVIAKMLVKVMKKY